MLSEKFLLGLGQCHQSLFEKVGTRRNGGGMPFYYLTISENSILPLPSNWMSFLQLGQINNGGRNLWGWFIIGNGISQDQYFNCVKVPCTVLGFYQRAVSTSYWGIFLLHPFSLSSKSFSVLFETKKMFVLDWTKKLFGYTSTGEWNAQSPWLRKISQKVFLFTDWFFHAKPTPLFHELRNQLMYLILLICKFVTNPHSSFKGLTYALRMWEMKIVLLECGLW